MCRWFANSCALLLVVAKGALAGGDTEALTPQCSARVWVWPGGVVLAFLRNARCCCMV